MLLRPASEHLAPEPVHLLAKRLDVALQRGVAAHQNIHDTSANGDRFRHGTREYLTLGLEAKMRRIG